MPRNSTLHSSPQVRRDFEARLFSFSLLAGIGVLNLQKRSASEQVLAAGPLGDMIIDIAW